VLGRYDAVRRCARQAIDLVTPEMQFGLVAAISHRIPGWVALAEEAYSEVGPPLREVRVLRNAVVRKSQEFTAWSPAGLGDRVEAQRHLREALEIVVEIRAFISLLHLMPIILVVLADEAEQGLRK